MWAVVFLEEAQVEFDALDSREAVAVLNAVEKLQAMGSQLPFPHSSAVQGADRLRELRPKAGRSPVRPLYRQFGETFVIGAIGPEAQVDGRGFDRACRDAEDRLDKVEE